MPLPKPCWPARKSATAPLITAQHPQHGPSAGGAGDNGPLRERLRTDGYRFYAGAGIGMSPGYDPEASLFVPGLAEAGAVALGQNAVLVVECGHPCRLVLSR